MASRLGQVAVPVDQAIQANLSEARAERLTPLLLLDGDRSQAVDLAKRFPDLVLIAYQSSGRPPLEVETSGATALMSPGSRGQYFVTLDLAGTDKTNYETHGLGPEIKDDPAASRLFHTYLKYVSEENLWEKTPKFPSPKFAGSERCGSCHRESLSVWRTSAHHRSLKTLRDKQEDKDPECIPCHVTGASLLTGFKSPFATPDLAFVGCESCHGPGLAHSLHPKSERMAKVGEQSCAPCHRSLNSPGFVFFRYWQQIAHKR
jgi:hypothetical protein